MLEDISSGERYQAVGPGRVNLLGEHVDYNEGIVLPAAIDRQVTISAEPVPGRLVTLRAMDLDQEVTFSLDHLDEKQSLNGLELPAWALYPAAIAWALQKHGLSVSGLRAAYTSDIPIGSGLSSSAAVLVGFANLWQAIGGWEATQLQLAQYSQEGEVQYVGVKVGLMDQFASACGIEGHALYFDTRSLEYFPVPLPPHSAIVIADSTMRRSLTTSAYNERRAQCESAVRILSAYLPGIHSLRDVSPVQFYQYAGELPITIRRRAQHIVEEIARVEEAVPRLQHGDAARFGQLMFAGHASLRDLYEVSIPELDKLVEIAAGLPGCWGARLTGAGFGGCTVNLVQEDATDAFIQGLKDGYQRATGRQAQVYLCHASQGARAMKIE